METKWYEVYYFNASDGIYHYQGSCKTLQGAKQMYNEKFAGYIKKIVKRYKGI